MDEDTTRDHKENVMDDQIFQSLAAGYPMHKVWMVSLSDMWDEVGKALGGRVRFLEDEPS